MHDDDFESSHGHSGNENQRQHKQTRKNILNEDDQPQKRSRDKQKATAIALSVVTCLFMCVIGYEIIRENSPKQEPQANIEKNKPSLFLSKMTVYENDLLSADENDDSYESHQIRLLQEQNRKQANKIKALRHELLEKMHAIHEVKANLFKQEGDPRDKAKIADLSQKLDEKEKAAALLSADMKLAEIEISALQRKIEHAEITRDALASMIENQRISKEQEYIIAQKQIEELKQSRHLEATELKGFIAELETSLALLDNAYKEKLDALDRVSSELTHHYGLLENKTAEHQSLADLYHQTREMMNRQILDLIASLEWEATSKANIISEYQTALERQDWEKSIVITLLEAELQKRNEIIAANEAEEGRHHNSMGYTAKQAQEQILNLITTLEFEMTRTSFLQKDLDKTVYIHRQHLDDKSQAISALETDLKKQEYILKKKGEELDNLMSVLHLTRDAHKEKINNLVASHEFETTKVNELQKTLNEKSFSDRNNHSKILALEQAVDNLKQSLSDKETLLAARQLELHALMAMEGETAHDLQKQAGELSHQIESGNLQLAKIHEEVVALTPYKESEKTYLEKITILEEEVSLLREALKEKQQIITEAQSALSDTQEERRNSEEQLQSLITSLKSELSEKEVQLDKQTSYYLELEELQSLITSVKNELSENEMLLEENIQNHQESLYRKEREIHSLTEAKRQVEQDLLHQISNLEAEIVREKNKAEDLESEYGKMSTQNKDHAKRLQEFELQIGILNSQLFEKEKELLATEEKLLLTLPQIDLLSTENQHLQGNQSDLTSKLNETTEVIRTQKKKIQELVDRLNEEQNLLKNHLARQEAQKLSEQQAAKKQEMTALRAALLEDQLTLNNAALKRYEKAIEKLEQSQVVLKDDYELQLEAAKADLENERERVREMHQDNRRIANEFKMQQKQTQEMQTALEQSNENISKLENEIEHLRHSLTEKSAQEKRKLDDITTLEKSLEDEKQKSKTIEGDLKKIIHAYTTEKQKWKNAEAAAKEDFKSSLEAERQKHKNMEADLKKVVSSNTAEDKN